MPVTSLGAPTGTLHFATHLQLSTAMTLAKSEATCLHKAGNSMTDPCTQPDGFFVLEAVYLTWSLHNMLGGAIGTRTRFACGRVRQPHGAQEYRLCHTIPMLNSIVLLSGVLLSLPPLSCCCFVAHSAEQLTTPPGTSAYCRLHAPSALAMFLMLRLPCASCCDGTQP